MYLISTVVFLANLVNAFLKKNSKLLPIGFIVLLCIIMGANTKNPDYFSYRSLYFMGSFTGELGFLIIIKIFNFFNIEYFVFRLVWTLVGFALIHQTLIKLTENHSAYYVLYAIFPFFIDAVQIRNFMVMAIFIFAFPYLIEDDYKGKIKYSIAILIASSIHYVSIVYLLFLLINVLKNNLKIRNLYIAFVAVLILISLNHDLYSIIIKTIFSTFALVYSQIGYYGNVLTRFGYLFYWVIQVGFIVLVNAILRQLKKNQENELDTSPSILKGKSVTLNYIQKFCTVVLWADLISIIFLPTYVIHSLFFRLFRNLIPLNYMAIIGSLKFLTGDNKIRRNIPIILILLSLMLFYVEIFAHFDVKIFKALMEYNWLLMR